MKIKPFMHGDEQERRWRAGTEYVPGIVGFAKATELVQTEITEEMIRLTGFRDRLITGLLQRIDHVCLNGHPEQRLPNNVNLSVDFVEGESMLLNLNLEDICASTGSACSSGSLEVSHVILAMGLSHVQAYGLLRFILGKWTTEEEIERVLDVLPRIVTKLRAMSPLINSRR